MTWNRRALAGALLAAMAAPLVLLPGHAEADLASAVNRGDYGPAVTIVTPQYADVVNGTSVAIAVAVQQRSNPVKAVQMFVDDQIATPGWVPLRSLQSSSFNWDTTLFKNGPHKLTVRVVDAQGLIGQAVVTVYVNNKAASSENAQSQNYSNNYANNNAQQLAGVPFLKWLGVNSGQVLKGTVNLQLEASGNFGVKYIFIMVNPVDDPDRKPALRSWMINQPPYIIPFDTTKINDGAYVLDALGYDALSNQGAAPRLRIGIANNSINPTWFNQLAPEQPKAEIPLAPAAPVNNPPTFAPANTGAAPQTASDAQTFVNLAAQLSLAPLPQRSGALSNQGSSRYNVGNENTSAASESGLTVSVNSSAEVRSSATQAAPRLSELPTRLLPQPPAAQKPIAPKSVPNTATVPAERTLPELAPLREAALPKEEARPVATIATTAPTPRSEPKSTVADSAPREATVSTIAMTHSAQRLAAADGPSALPKRLAVVNETAPETVVESAVKTPRPAKQEAPRTAPQATLANTAFPAGAVATTTAATSSVPQQRFAAVSEALSTPRHSYRASASTTPVDRSTESRVAKATPQDKSNAALPQFPAATAKSLPRTTASKSTFADKPALGIAGANVASRLTRAEPAVYDAVQSAADVQLGTLPQQARSTVVSAARIAATPVLPARPQVLFTTPAVSVAASATAPSRIATLQIPGETWNYRRETTPAQSTRPNVAFLPDFKKRPTAAKPFSAITVAPVDASMQVSETSHAWPAVYVSKADEPLAEVAKRYGLPVEIVAANNNLKETARIKAGQKIRMPRNLQVTYNGKPVQSDVRAMLVGSTSVAAFRFLFEQQGGSVTWDPATQTVRAKNADNEVTLTIGSNKATVNQKEVMMDLAAFLLSGRTMVPVRLFEESLHAQVNWDPATGRMVVAMAGSNS